MNKRYIVGGLATLALFGGAIAAYTLTPTTHAGSPTELPELGRVGEYNIATRVESIALPDRPVITASSAITGSVTPAPRRLQVRMWYPTSATEGERATYERDLSRNPDSPLPFIFEGIALQTGPAITTQRFPLVVMSHGYGGWAEHFSFLGEHIASHGYVVASINHADAGADGAISFLLSFGNVLQNRALDQRQVLNALLAKSTAKSSEGDYAAAIDNEHVAIIGYSMGGYGALSTAGAAYDYDGEGLSGLPNASKAAMQVGTGEPPTINALVAIAPWGGAPNNRSWNAEGLAKLSVPALIIAGNQDDVVDFDNGVRWLFDNATNSHRHLLVYREARHNIAGNAITSPNFPANQDFATAEYIREPVWRTERLNAINQHFITAFLDLHLKGDSDKSSYLNPPTSDANASVWPTSLGEQLNGALAGKDQPSHWRGFQRRWALGMEMHTRAKGE